jgi:dihydroneopterin aldolase
MLWGAVGAPLTTDRISLSNMAFYGYHGIAPGEKTDGQRFFVDVDLFVDLQPAGAKDEFSKTIDYEGVFSLIKESVEVKRFHIIEALAEHIARAILKRYAVERVVVRVRKPHVPIQGILDHTEVEISRSRPG